MFDFYYKLPEESFNSFNNIFELQLFKKGDNTDTFFIMAEGIARSVITDKKNHQKTRSFFQYPICFDSPESTIQGKNSVSEINCLTDTRIYKGSFKAFLGLSKEDHHISTLYNRFLEQSFVMMTKKVNALSVLDAKQRYLNLKKEIPYIEDLVMLKDIASYLNITPIQLSKIRKEPYSNL